MDDLRKIHCFQAVSSNLSFSKFYSLLHSADKFQICCIQGRCQSSSKRMFIQVINAVPDHAFYLLLMKISYIYLGHMDWKTTVFSRVAIRRAAGRNKSNNS